MNRFYEALKVRKRTSSQPSRLSRPAYRYRLPEALVEALGDRRYAYGTYAEGMQQVQIEESQRNSPPAATIEEEVKKDEEVVPVSAALPEEQREEQQQRQEQEQLREQEAQAEAEAEAVAAEEGAAERPSVVPYDANQMAKWMDLFRNEDAHCPPAIAAFAKKIREISATATTTESPLSRAPAASPKGVPSDRAAFFGSKVTDVKRAPTNTSQPRADALEALSTIWEDRMETPIAVGGLRRGGLFGGGKKELYQMVIACLNKVTGDPGKFREVKNELLRLPIPEANTEQIDKIVGVFFTKAIREQHFSHSYADLISALCKVPQGQHITGDYKQSLEYRLRRALVKRCQAEFLDDVTEERQPENQAASPADEEKAALAKERRDRMCGNVRFISELFLQGIITGGVIDYILCMSCNGLDGFAMPPIYRPMESQFDVIITTVKAVGKRFFVETVEGRQLLPPLLECLQYWQQHFSVSRIRFLLMELNEKLRRMLLFIDPELAQQQQQQQQQPAPPPPPPQHLATLTFPQVVGNSRPDLNNSNEELKTPENSMLHQSNNANGGGTPHDSETSSVNNIRRTEKQTMVGGKPLPAPRSLHNANNGNNSVGSPNNSQLIMSTSYPALEPPEVSFIDMPTKIAVRVEQVAQLMASAATLSMDALAAQAYETYGNVAPLAYQWTLRCLSVVREEKTRLITGQFFAALVENAPEQEKEALRNCLWDIMMDAFIETIEKKIHEDLGVFKFWAQLALSDPNRAVLNEDLLNDGLEFLTENAPEAVKDYLVQVGRYYSLMMSKGPVLMASDESSDFVRYRPLLRLHLLHEAVPQYELSQMNNKEVRLNCIEADIFCGLCTGDANVDALFEKIRSSPRLETDPTLAAEVLSAIVVAEACTPSHAFLEVCMSLLLLAVDGPNRSEREALLLAELYAFLEMTPKQLPASAVNRVVAKLIRAKVLSDETTERLANYFHKEGDEELSNCLRLADRPSNNSSSFNSNGNKHVAPNSGSTARPHSGSAGGGGGGGGSSGTYARGSSIRLSKAASTTSSGNNSNGANSRHAQQQQQQQQGGKPRALGRGGQANKSGGGGGYAKKGGQHRGGSDVGSPMSSTYSDSYHSHYASTKNSRGGRGNSHGGGGGGRGGGGGGGGRYNRN